MAVAGKRFMSPSEAPPSKAARGPGPEDADQWACPKCGNLNFGHRVVCNMRKCGAPRAEEPWVCAGCGNENYPGRMFCNMRRCQLARPGLTAVALKQYQQQEQLLGPVGNGKGFAAPAGGKGGGFVAEGRANEPGAWTCLSCGNMNYPGRTVCNSRKCGKPRELAGEAPEQTFGAKNNVFMAPSAVPAMHAGYADGAGKGGGKSGAAPPGSWVCLACNNVNYPTRTSCNAKACGRLRAEIDGGPAFPEAGADVGLAGGCGGGGGGGGGGDAPPGSWVCVSCSNVNYPNRTVCNKRNCGMPKPEEGL